MLLMNLVDWTHVRKESLSLRISQQDFSKTEKQTEKIVKKKKGTEYPRIVVQLPKVQSSYNGKIRGEKRKEQKKYLK